MLCRVNDSSQFRDERHEALLAAVAPHLGIRYGSLELLSLPYRCCGFRLHVSKVGEHEVDYLGHPEGQEDFVHWYRGQSNLDD